MSNVAIQLYSLRDLNEPLPEIIHRVADAGFDGVEFAHRIRSANPAAVSNALESTGLEPVGAHVELRTLDAEWDRLLSVYETVGVERIIIPHLPFDHFLTTTRIEAMADRLEGIADRLADRGMRLLFHNTREVFYPPLNAHHIPEFMVRDAVPTLGWLMVAETLGRLDTQHPDEALGRSGFARLVKLTSPAALTFEVDIKNVVAAGLEPSQVYEHVGDRLELIHVSDIDRTRSFPPAFEAVDPGTGLVDLPREIALGRETRAEWLVFEHDRPSDPMTALQQGVDVMAEVLDPIVTPAA